MKNLLIAIISFFSTFCYSQQKKIKHINGYIVFVTMNDYVETLFLPKKNASYNFTFNQLAKVKGWLIRGQDGYETYKAKQLSRKYFVSVPILDTCDSFSNNKIELGIIPVKMTYFESPPGKIKEDGGIPFDYKGKRYVIKYIDDWDIVIESITVLK